MNAWKCDRCGKYSDIRNIIQGNVQHKAIGFLTKRYPNEHHLCDECADSLEKLLQSWWKDAQCKG